MIYNDVIFDIVRDCCNYEISVGCDVDNDDSLFVVHIKLPYFSDDILKRVPVSYRIVDFKYYQCLIFELPYNCDGLFKS